MEQTQEANAEAKTEHWAIFWLEAQGGIRERKFFDGLFQVFILIITNWKKSGVDKRENVFVTW